MAWKAFRPEISFDQVTTYAPTFGKNGRAMTRSIYNSGFYISLRIPPICCTWYSFYSEVLFVFQHLTYHATLSIYCSETLSPQPMYVLHGSLVVFLGTQYNFFSEVLSMFQNLTPLRTFSNDCPDRLSQPWYFVTGYG